MNLSQQGKYVNRGFSNELENQLEEINEFKNKLIDSLLEKITEFKKGNKDLIELNKSSLIELKSLQTSMTEAQKDAEKLEEDYNIFQLTNKELLLKLQNINKLTKSNDVDHCEELQNRNLLNEDNLSISSCLSSEGSLVIFVNN